jgi:hypothetical protein
MECVSSISCYGRSTRYRTAMTRHQLSASAKRWLGRTGWVWRPIRRIHLQGGSTRPRNSVSIWNDRASSPVPAVARTPRRRRRYAAPCCSPLQTSLCERASHRPLYCGALRARASSLAPGSWVIVASNAVLHASLSSAFFFLRQDVISSALGINALQSLSTSGVHAMRCSSVPCENEWAGDTVADSRVNKMLHDAERANRSIIHIFWHFTLIRGPAIRSPGVDTRGPARHMDCRDETPKPRAFP